MKSNVVKVPSLASHNLLLLGINNCHCVLYKYKVKTSANCTNVWMWQVVTWEEGEGGQGRGKDRGPAKKWTGGGQEKITMNSIKAKGHKKYSGMGFLVGSPRTSYQEHYWLAAQPLQITHNSHLVLLQILDRTSLNFRLIQRLLPHFHTYRITMPVP